MVWKLFTENKLTYLMFKSFKTCTILRHQDVLYTNNDVVLSYESMMQSANCSQALLMLIGSPADSNVWIAAFMSFLNVSRSVAFKCINQPLPSSFSFQDASFNEDIVVI